MAEVLKAAARPICLIMLVFTLCVLAIFGEAPTWFLGMSIPIVSGLMIERAVRKTKGNE